MLGRLRKWWRSSAPGFTPKVILPGDGYSPGVAAYDRLLKPKPPQGGTSVTKASGIPPRHEGVIFCDGKALVFKLTAPLSVSVDEFNAEFDRINRAIRNGESFKLVSGYALDLME